MLYLKALSIDRFKSFKHVNLLFKNGFNCVVGPNGSGKSNIIDALLFSLGETSLRRLRVRKLDELIHTTGAKRASSLSKAHVKLEFGGDEKLEITRGVRADGKTVFRLNGKRMTRQEVLEVLKKHRVHIDETSTITQGEINKLIDLNPKQRRELIDLAAGIKEFEYKKNEALSELEKVGAKVSEAQAILNERLGFLKSLEKEKEAAESHIAMTKKLRALNYNILTKRRSSIQSALDSYAIELVNLENKRRGLEKKVTEVSNKISILGDERQKLTRVLGESSGVLGDIGKRQKEIESEFSSLEYKITNGNVAISQAKTEIEDSKLEISKKEEKIKSNASEVALLREKIGELEGKISTLGDLESGGNVSAGKKVIEISTFADVLEKEVAEKRGQLLEIKSSEASLASQKENISRELSRINELISSNSKAVADSKEKTSSLSTRKNGLEKDLAHIQMQLEQTRSEIGRVDTEILALKEQRATSGARGGALQDKIKRAFGMKDGFYGTAAELCEYENQYAEAVEAAAGSRFSYLVVDSIDVANTIIQYLKKQNLGRATFIPLQELNVGDEKKEKELKAVTGLLSYDSKFKRAFAYIFSDTYLVDSVEQAKQLGVGRHRFVTVTGETVEKSGVLSGGARGKTMPIATLDKRIKELEKEQKELAALATELGNKGFDCRKDLASADIETASANSFSTDLTKKISQDKEQALALEKEEKKTENELSRLIAQSADLGKSISTREKELANKKEELKSAYEDSLHLAKTGMKKEDRAELERARKETEEAKVKSAEIQQESKMLSQNREELSKIVKEKGIAIERTQKEMGADLKRRAELEELKAKVEQEIKNSDKSNKKAYDRLEVINAEVLKLGQEQGTANTSSDTVAKQIEDLRVKKGQLDVRLNDITAELTAYGDSGIEEINQEIESMEKEAALLNSKIVDLGNVNLKAPEVYGEKVRSVSDATEKVNTLETEKRAVLSMIEEIDSKKLNAFVTTFNEVNKNFSKLYNYIFPGSAHIELEDEANPLNGGLDIKIADGKGFKRINLLSGGQRSLISLVLIFSIHMCKPSAVYLFDEIDSALDKENSKKLSQLIKEMGKDAQFIVVSHNDSLIVNADAALGVVKTADESKVVGIEISSIANK